MAKDDGNTKLKKKDASSASLSSADTSGLRRSSRETPSKKQATESPSNTRRSGRVENQTPPISSPIKKKPDKIEEQIGPSSLRRSDRSKKQLSTDSSGSKKLVEVPASPNMKSNKEKTASSLKEDAGDDSVETKNDNENERQDPDVGGRKRKRMTVLGYKALFKPQRLRIEAENGQGLNMQNASPESGRSTESGNGEKQIGCKCSQDNNEKMSTQNMDIDACAENDNQISPESPSSRCKKHADDETRSACSKEQRINNDSKNQQEVDSHDKTCDKDLHGASTSKVRKTCQEAAVMENTESNNSKFVEFWVPVQISNVQLEQYCFTILSGAISLRSCSKSDSFGALNNILNSNRKCCDHPYIANNRLRASVATGQPQNVIFDLELRASGKLHFLDLILPEVRRQQLRVVILFQPQVGNITNGVASSSSSKKDPPLTTGDFLDDLISKRFGEKSYERAGVNMIPGCKQDAINNFNKDMNKFVFFIEPKACNSSVKLSAVDIVIIFNSDLNPENDIKALQKISIDSNSEKIMVFRLYSKNTLEEKVLKLAEQNVAVDSKQESLNRMTCDLLLMWGAEDLFTKLDEFLSDSGKDVTSGEAFLKEAREEFLHIVSNKCKSKDAGNSNSLITKVQSCGLYGNKNIPFSEIKSQLNDGEQPHVFWRNLLDGKAPRWRFVPMSTSRQRKKPHDIYNPSDTDAVKRRKKSPVLKPVLENETGGANEDLFLSALNEAQSSSDDQFWAITVSNGKSLPDLLKPDVKKLCEILKFPVDATNIVEKFLDFVLKNYRVSKEHGNTDLQAFMISVCWIGASLAEVKIDRIDSFDLAKKHLNFECKEERANSVYIKLEEAKEAFLKQTDVLIPQAISTESKEEKMSSESQHKESKEQNMSSESQHNQTVETSENQELLNDESLETTEKESEAIEKFNREWDEKRANLELEYEVEQSLIRQLFTNAMRSDRLKKLKEEFGSKFKELERDKDIHLKDLKSKLQADDVAADNEPPLSDTKQGGENSNNKPETPVSAGNPDEASGKMTEMPLESDGGRVQGQSNERGSLGIGDDIESTSSHTSEKQTVDATVSSAPFVEVPPHQHDTAGDGVAVILNEEVPPQQCDGTGNDADSVELQIPEVDSNQENGKGDSSVADVAVPGGDKNKEDGEDGIITPPTDKSQAVEEQNDSCGSSNSNQPSAGAPQDDTPSIQQTASQPSDHPMPTVLEIEDDALLEQLLDLGMQETVGQADPNSLPEINVDAQINSEEPHDDPVAEIQSDTRPAPANEVVGEGETTRENDTNAPEPQTSAPPEIPNQNTSRPEIMDVYNIQVASSRIPKHGDPLQAELERLCAIKDTVTKLHEDKKEELKSECEKELTEMIAKINQKYEAKWKEEETVFHSKKKELDTSLNRVMMNKILAEAFRAKCQDLIPPAQGMQSVYQAGLMQQLHRSVTVRPSAPSPSPSPSPSPGQRQQTPPPPPLPPVPPPPVPPPPLQIVHQPAALFSNTVIRTPPAIHPATPISRPPPNITTNTRPPPTITPVTPTTRPPPNITPLTPSAGSLRAPAPHLRPLVNTEMRAPAPHIRPFKPATSASPDFTYRRVVLPGQQVTCSLNSQSPVLPPLPPESSYVPPPPPPPSPPQDHQRPPPVMGTISQKGREYELLDLTDIFPVDDARPSSVSGPDLVCLSDDD